MTITESEEKNRKEESARRPSTLARKNSTCWIEGPAKMGEKERKDRHKEEDERAALEEDEGPAKMTQEEDFHRVAYEEKGPA